MFVILIFEYFVIGLNAKEMMNALKYKYGVSIDIKYLRRMLASFLKKIS